MEAFWFIFCMAWIANLLQIFSILAYRGKVLELLCVALIDADLYYTKQDSKIFAFSLFINL
jgi:hypothetical protein